MFHETTFDRGTSGEAALHIHGQGSGGASHDVLVADSIIRNGGRTVFVLGRFAPVGAVESPSDLRQQRDHLRSERVFPDLGRPRHPDREQPDQRHDDLGRSHRGRDARHDQPQSLPRPDGSSAGGDADRESGHGVGQLRRRRKHDLERGRHRQQRGRRLGDRRAARRRARRLDRLQHRRRPRGHRFNHRTPHDQVGQRDPERQQRDQGLEQYPPDDQARAAAKRGPASSPTTWFFRAAAAA